MALDQHVGHTFAVPQLLRRSFCSDKRMNSTGRALKVFMEVY
jgi:hypothetical protein